MNWLIIIIASLIFIFVIGLIIDISIEYDLKKNYGMIIIKLFAIPIIFFELKIARNGIDFRGRKKKKSWRLKIDSKTVSFINNLKNNIINYLYIDYINSNITVNCTRPDVAVLFNSAIATLLSIIFYKIRRNQSDVIIYQNQYTGFDTNNLTICLNARVVISLLDVIWAVIKTIFERKYKYGKQY